MREKPVFPAHSRVPLESGPKPGLPGWRRSPDRTCLRTNSLQTGSFTGKFQISRARRPIPARSSPRSYALFSGFPVEINRENIDLNREFESKNSDFDNRQIDPAEAALIGVAYGRITDNRRPILVMAPSIRGAK